jgi:phosphoribosylcarboxyaminoimidazole (NCAIR) mutase
VAIMAGKHPELRKKLRTYRKTLEEKVLGAKV